jgi:hypothetical protein
MKIASNSILQKKPQKKEGETVTPPPKKNKQKAL